MDCKSDEGTDTLSATAKINEWVDLSLRSNTMAATDYIFSQNQISDLMDKKYSSQVTEGMIYLTTESCVASIYAINDAVSSLI